MKSFDDSKHDKDEEVNHPNVCHSLHSDRLSLCILVFGVAEFERRYY